MVYSVDDISNLVLNLLFYFIIGSFGAFVKDLYESMTKKVEQIRLGKIIVGATSSMFICMVLQEMWQLSITTVVPLTFLLGVLGFEIFGNVTSIESLKRFLVNIVEFKRYMSQQDAQPPLPPPSPTEDVDQKPPDEEPPQHEPSEEEVEEVQTNKKEMSK